MTLSIDFKALNFIGAAKLQSLAGAVRKRQHLTVETDANKLVKYCCGANIYTDDKPDPEIKSDSEYPDWLFEMHLDWEPIPLESLSKTDPLYWRRVIKLNKLREKREMSVKHRNKDFGPRLRFVP